MSQVCLGSTGREWWFYKNTGDYATPVWALVDLAKDITVNLTKEEIESRRRGASFIEFLKGMKDLTLDVPLKWAKGNTHLDSFRADFFADDCAHFDLFIADGPAATAGTEGVRCIVALTNFTMNLGLGDEATVDLSFRPTYVLEGSTPVESEWLIISGP